MPKMMMLTAAKWREFQARFPPPPRDAEAEETPKPRRVGRPRSKSKKISDDIFDFEVDPEAEADGDERINKKPKKVENFAMKTVKGGTKIIKHLFATSMELSSRRR